jgi:hypothetical protein
MHGEHEGLGADDGHRADVAPHVEGQFFVECRRIGNAHALQQQRVAVGRRLGGDVGGDHAAAARAVIDDHLLAPDPGKPLGEKPRDDVGAAAGGRSCDKRTGRSGKPAAAALPAVQQAARVMAVMVFCTWFSSSV